MQITTATIQSLRAQTGAGMMDCKKALEESGGDIEAAKDWLREHGAIKAAKRADRETNEGVIECYIHAGGKVGVLLALTCETDFVARSDRFKELARDIAMHIAAADPQYLCVEDIPAEVLERERAVMRAQVQQQGKPEDMLEKIVEGKLSAWYAEACLMNQKFVKRDEVTIAQMLGEAVAALGERVEVKRFARFALSGSNTGCGF